MLQRRKVGFHSDLDQLVSRICQKNHDKLSGYNMMKQKLAEQDRERQLKRKAAGELAVQPLIKKNAVEKVVCDRRMIPINTKTKDFPPLPSTLEEVPVPSPLEKL